MRGVYFKNMKWQAAIKVEKKQVHLGTVNSQEEAARLYDRFVINSPFLIETKLDHFTSLCRTRDWCWKKDLEAASKSGMFVRCRAAYLCGREPNFELTEAEKQELQLLQWEDFLEQTRQSILSKSTCSKIHPKSGTVGCYHKIRVPLFNDPLFLHKTEREVSPSAHALSCSLVVSERKRGIRNTSGQTTEAAPSHATFECSS